LLTQRCHQRLSLLTVRAMPTQVKLMRRCQPGQCQPRGDAGLRRLPLDKVSCHGPGFASRGRGRDLGARARRRGPGGREADEAGGGRVKAAGGSGGSAVPLVTAFAAQGRAVCRDFTCRGNYDHGTLSFPERVWLRRLRLWKTVFAGPLSCLARGRRTGGNGTRNATGRYVHTMWTGLWTTTAVVESSSSYTPVATHP
jgi:hypothetical protein